VRLFLPGTRYGVEINSLKPTEDPDLIAELNQFVSDATSALEKTHRNWQTYDDYYDGIQAINRNIADTEIDDKEYRDRKAMNFCMPTIETMIPILKDASPIWYVLYEGQDEVGPELARDVTGYIQGYWHYRQMEHVLEEVYRDMTIYGTGALKVYYDSQLLPTQPLRTIDEDGGVEEEESEPLGDVAMEWLDPFCVYHDPCARSLDECRFLALKTEMTKEDLKRQFPNLDEDNLGTVSDREARRLRLSAGREFRKDLVEVWEVYHKFGKRLTIYTSSQIVYDGDNPTPRNRFPIVLFTDRRRGGNMLGRSEIGDLISTQDFLNSVNFRIARHERMSGNPQKVTNDDRITEVTNEAGAVVFVRPMISREKGYIRWETPPPIPAHTFTYLQWLERTFDTQSGVQDVTQGVRPKGITSGIALAQLSEAAQARLRLMISSTAISLQEVGQLVLELMQENYAEDRQISYFGAEEPVQVSIYPEALHEEAMGGVLPYRCVVQSRGDLPLNPAAQLDIAIQLKRENVLDAIEVLKVANWPGREEVIQRMMQAEQQQMMGAMAAQGAMPPEAGAGGAPALPPELEAFSPEELEIIVEIMGGLESGQALTPEQLAFLEALSDEQKQALVCLMGSEVAA